MIAKRINSQNIVVAVDADAAFMHSNALLYTIQAFYISLSLSRHAWQIKQKREINAI